jgi:plastocyanin
MRRKILLLAVPAILACATSASAATVMVTVGPGGSLSYSPADATINVGDTVHWVWSSLFPPHSTTSGSVPTPDGLWDSGQSGSPHSFDHIFPTAGTFRYFCSVHLSAMTGTITVKGAGSPPPPKPPRITALKIAPARLCTRHSSRCKHPGAKLTFTLSARAKVVLKVTRRGGTRTLKRLTLNGKAGKNTTTFSGSGLSPGSYVLAATASASGLQSKAARVGFTVVAS